MKKKENFVPVFIFFLVLSILIFGLSQLELFRNFLGIIGEVLSPIQKITYQSFQSVTNFNKNENLRELKEENSNLIRQLVNQKLLEKENSALRDQFETSKLRSTNLLPAKILSAPSFIPNISEPSIFIIDKGENDRIRIGDAAVYKDSLVGKVVELTPYLSKINLITNASVSFAAKTIRTNAVGVIKGEGGRQMVLDNILQSADIKESDLIVSKGDLDIKGRGYPSDLVVGKVVSVEKKPSALFQKADVVSLLDFSNLSTVFIIRQL